MDLGSSEMARRIAAFDWSATPLGPLATWPQSLRTGVELMLASGFACALHVGREAIYLYNDACAELIAEHHPAALGRPSHAAFPESAGDRRDVFERVWRGETVTANDTRIRLTRAGRGDTAWLTMTYAPLRDEHGAVGGVFVTAIETTERHRSEEALRASEAKYRSLFDSIDEGFALVEMMFDAAGTPIDGRILECNAAQERLTGIRNASGKRLRELIPQLEDRWLERFGAVARTGEPARFEGLFAGTQQWFDVRATRLGEPDSRTVALVFDDISGRKRAQARDFYRVQLADTLRRLRASRDVQAAATRALGMHLRVQRVQYAKIAGGEPVIETEYTDGLPAVGGALDLAFGGDVVRMYRSGRAAVCEDVHAAGLPPATLAAFVSAGVRAYAGVPLLKQGEWVAVMIVATATPRAWRPDELALISETADRTWAALERVRATEELGDAARRKDEFLAMLAHELRNPLAPLRTAVEVLRMDDVPRHTVDELTRMMQRQIQHMVRLVDDLLDVSRITRDKIRLQKTPAKVGDLVRVAVDANRAALDDKQLELAVDLRARDLELDVDETRVIQVLSNVLHNACKFTPDGGEIRISARRERDDLVLAIADTGDGIDPALLPRIFELFTQGGERGGGLGIGLALARRLVEMHGGRIAARSAGRGHGAEIEIRLPITHGAARGDDAAPAPAPAPADAAVRVVIIDDNRDAANATALLVRVLGGEPEVAYNGTSGIERVLELKPDVVLLDIGMPGLDGYETCRRIRREMGTSVRVVAVTGWSQAADKQRALDAGFDAHLTKPADPAVLRRFLVRTASAPE